MIHPMRRFFYHTFWTLLSLLVTLAMLLGVIYVYMEWQLPDVSVLKDMHLQVPMRIYTADGKLIAQYGAKRRIPVTLKQMPKQLIQAMIATEDARYFSHPGVDFIGILRAGVAVLSSGRKVQGASTITMQVARNFFLTRKKTYRRKINEILLALKINRELPKEKILELYLNKVYFGNRAYGVAAAAKVYYGKTLKQLTLPQMAMLAGLPQAPSRNNPLNNRSAALKRRNHVLWRMWDVGFIDKKAYEKAIKAPVTARYHGRHVEMYAPYVAEMVRQVMVSEYGRRAYDLGLNIHTTINSTLQYDAQRAMRKGLISYSQRHGYIGPITNLGAPQPKYYPTWERWLSRVRSLAGLTPAIVVEVDEQDVQILLASGAIVPISWEGLSWARLRKKDRLLGPTPKRASDILSAGDVIWAELTPDGQWQLSQIPKVQGAIVSLNVQDGAILAVVGGFDYRLSNYNRATQAARQPGSNFKPFIYSAALAKGYTLATIINDAPIVIYDTGENQLWRPNNSDKQFHGPTRLRVGLMKSRNIVSIRLLKRIGIDYTLKYIRRFGLDPDRLPHSLSLALGSGEVTPLKIAVGYSVFANGGYRVVPYYIQKITDQYHRVLYQAAPMHACQACITNAQPATATLPMPIAPQVITPQNAYLMTSALKSVIQQGTGRGALVLKRNDLAGKTGTTNEQVDAWFTGFNHKIVTTVWVGYDSLASLKEYGAQAALPIWVDYMRLALAKMPEQNMPVPPDIVTVRINPYTGTPASPSQRAIFEKFRAQYQPGRRSRHRSHAGMSQSEHGFGSDGVSNGPAQAGDSIEELF